MNYRRTATKTREEKNPSCSRRERWFPFPNGVVACVARLLHRFCSQPICQRTQTYFQYRRIVYPSILRRGKHQLYTLRMNDNDINLISLTISRMPESERVRCHTDTTRTRTHSGARACGLAHSQTHAHRTPTQEVGGAVPGNCSHSDNAIKTNISVEDTSR